MECQCGCVPAELRGAGAGRSLGEACPAAAGGALAPAPDPIADTNAATSSWTTQVKLVEAGAEPRKVLRLHPNPGDKQTLTLTMKMAMETRLARMQTQAMKMPAIKITLDSTVKEVSDNGDITYELVMGDVSVSSEPGVDPQAAEAYEGGFRRGQGNFGHGHDFQPRLQQGVGVQSAGRQQSRDPQGYGSDEGILHPRGPVPEEAVGPGAKWEVKMPIKTQGMTIDQTATYEMVSLEGERLTTKSTFAQHAANQKIQTPAMPGMKVDLTKMIGKGSGERTFDLAKLLPSEGTWTFTPRPPWQ